MFFVLLYVIPFQVQAADTDQEQQKHSSLLNNTVTSLLGTTEVIVNSVQETVTEVEQVVPVLKPVTNIVSEVEKATLPVMHDVVTGVTEATGSTLSGVVDEVEKTVETLPEVPVVTPVLNNTTETLDAVTSEVQTIVDASEETVGNIVNIMVEEKEEPKPVLVTNPDIKSITNSNATTITTNEDKAPSLQSELEVSEEAKRPAKEQVIDETVGEVPAPAQPTIVDTIVTENSKDSIKITLINLDTESFHPRELTDSDEKEIKVMKKVVKKQIVEIPVTPAIPLGPEQKMIINGGATWGGQTNASSIGLSFLNSGNDVLQGFLPSDEMLKDLTKKKWYHKNSYAIVQWIHTPLRKPPEVTPFLYVI